MRQLQAGGAGGRRRNTARHPKVRRRCGGGCCPPDVCACAGGRAGSTVPPLRRVRRPQPLRKPYTNGRTKRQLTTQRSASYSNLVRQTNGGNTIPPKTWRLAATTMKRATAPHRHTHIGSTTIVAYATVVATTFHVEHYLARRTQGGRG